MALQKEAGIFQLAPEEKYRKNIVNLIKGINNLVDLVKADCSQKNLITLHEHRSLLYNQKNEILKNKTLPKSFQDHISLMVADCLNKTRCYEKHTVNAESFSDKELQQYDIMRGEINVRAELLAKVKEDRNEDIRRSKWNYC